MTNSQLGQHIEKLLKAVLGMKTVSKSKVDDVLFRSESETEKKSGSSENEKMQSDVDKTPEPKLASHDVLENEGRGRSESDGPKTSDGSRKSEDSDKSEPITDMLFYLDEDDIELLDNLSYMDRLKVFDAVSNMKNFPGYKPGKADESLCDIVTRSIGLMKILSMDGTLDENEVGEVEDMLREIKAEKTRLEWIKKSKGSCGCGGAVPKKDREVHKKSQEKLPEKSPVKFTPEGSPVKEKETEKVVSDIIEKMEIDEEKDEEKGVKVVEENGKAESDGKGMTGDEKGVTNVGQEGMTAIDVQVHQTKGSEDNKCENKTEGMTSVRSDVHEGETGNEVATLCKKEEQEPKLEPE